MYLAESLRLFHRYLKPYYQVLVCLCFANLLLGMLLSARPMVLAPALDQLMSSDVPPASR